MSLTGENGYRQWRALSERYETACQQFREQEISEAVFSATLFGLGYRRDDIRAEINLIIMARQERGATGG